LLFGTKAIAWSRNPDESLQNTVVGSAQTGNGVEAFAHLYKRGPFATLGDLDKTTVYVFVTESLVEKIAHVSFAVNDYMLIGVPKEMVATPEQVGLTRRDPLTEWPETLTKEERQEQWVGLYLKGPNFGVPSARQLPPPMSGESVPWGIDFGGYTPVKSR
jgi:hypothetical protein